MATRHRSPNYPAAGLGEAVLLLKKFYAQAKRTAVDEVSAALAIGYGSLNGVSRTKLSILKKYGLFQEIDGKFRISDLGLRIVVPSEDDDYVAALREAALAPPLFREIHTSHADASPSILVSHLMREKGFTEDGARAFDASYRETVKVAKLDTATYTPEQTEEVTQEKPLMPGQQQQSLQQQQPRPHPQQTQMATDGDVSFNVPYRGATLSVRVEVKGQPLGRAHVEKVVRYLQMVAEDFPEVSYAPASLTHSGDPEDDAGISSGFTQTNRVRPRAALGVSVPVMITKKMELDLRSAGYTSDEIAAMTPQRAHDILEATKN